MGKLDKLRSEVGANVDESTEGHSPSAKPVAAAPSKPARMVGVDRCKDAALIDIERIVPDPDQPRKEFGETSMEEMKGSLLQHGQLQPIMVYWNPGIEKYTLIYGERRYRGAQLAGITQLICLINDRKLSPSEILEIQVIENLVREDLKPIEKAHSIRRLIDEFGYTQERAADRLKMSQPAIAQALSLLNLAPEVAAQVDKGLITKKAAYQIARVENPEAQAEVAAQVVSEGLDEAGVAEVVKKKRAAPKPRRSAGRKNVLPRKFTSKVFNQSGIKIEARKGRGGFDLAELRTAVAGVLERIDSELADVA
jgi:ParB family chromosome partitioning protein